MAGFKLKKPKKKFGFNLKALAPTAPKAPAGPKAIKSPMGFKF